MRVVKAEPVAPRRWAFSSVESQRAARIERLGLVATTCVALFGIWLTCVEQAAMLGSSEDFWSRSMLATVVYALSFWIAHVVRWRYGTIGDPLLLPIVQLASGLGLLAMYAVGDPTSDTLRAEAMSYGVAAGCALWTAVGFIDFEDPRFKRAILLPLGAAVLLAIALIVFGSGPRGSGARVNLLGFQPVEIIRLLVVFSLAAYFARRWKFLRELSDGRMPRWIDVRPLLASLVALLLLFFLQRDLGPALVLSCVFFGLYGIARGRAPLVIASFALLFAGFAAGYWLGFPDTVRDRIAMALDPWENGLRGGDQIAHSLWAFSTGGPLGMGPGVGDPQLIPAAHTDLVLAVLGEELGLIGVLATLGLFALLTWRMLRIALRAPGDYTMFLAGGLALALVVQGAVIVTGILGLIPLSGVVTPFVSYGRSSMLSNMAAVAICAAIARRLSDVREPFVRPVRTLAYTLAVVAAVVLWRVADVQAFRADAFATRPNVTVQADGVRRNQYNPRLVVAARQIVRGTIFDRNGLPMATSRPEEIAKFADHFRRAGIALPAECKAAGARCYPLGSAAFHLIGESVRSINWGATNQSYIEHDFDGHLKGYDDLRELLPLVRHRKDPDHDDVRGILARDRNLYTTIDARLQLRASAVVRNYAERAGSGRGAAVVIDAGSGQLLASVSYPEPSQTDLSGATPADDERLLDRARYGLYPPGSTFKVVTAAAALRSAPEARRTRVNCRPLPDGRVGGMVPGVPHPIRDDLLDHRPHGTVDLHRGLVVSCNLYFATLAQQVGAAALADAASEAQIQAARQPVVENLKRTLPFAGYGQAEVLASPLRMARVVAALATDGMLRPVHVRKDAADATEEPRRWLSADAAGLLRTYLREVVTSGTGRVLAGHSALIAGKTGTAEVDEEKSHSWFVGYAPHGGRRPIAFATVIENAGYGAQYAAPVAGEIVTAAQSFGLLK
jgi:cell division protein FtsW (lipid II flippase)/cell division protein FtsI/penicillin-binding protein 2